MSGIKGTQTEKNLMNAFAGESQARNRYTFFASKAKKEGYVQISLVFEETANQEKEHAKRFWSFLEGGEVEVRHDFPAGFPGGLVGSTLDNLKHAAAGEKYEHTTMYPEYADIAEQEGFSDVADCFRQIAKAEVYHEYRYAKLAKNIEENKVFHREQPIKWRCLNCSYTVESTEPPKVCPACLHPQAYYELLADNF